MKIVDKYILRTLLAPLFYCLATFIMLFVVHDLYEHLSDFIDAQTEFGLIIRYYALLVPSAFIFITPVATLLAVLYALYQLTHHNELTAMRASGISLYRLLTPVVIIGFVLSVVVTAVNEAWGPKAAYWAHIFIDQQKNNEADLDPTIGRAMSFRNTFDRRTWYMKAFDSKTLEMRGVVLTQERDNGFNEYKVYADHAEWLDGGWVFRGNVITKTYNEQGYPFGLPKTEKLRIMDQLTEQPDIFVNLIKHPSFLSGLELKRYLAINRQLTDSSRAILRTDLWFKFAMPWACLISSLLGVPFGFTTARQGVKRGIVVCISVFFGYYGLSQVFLALGKNQTLHPFAATWVPNLLFLVVGIVLLARMR